MIEKFIRNFVEICEKYPLRIYTLFKLSFIEMRNGWVLKTRLKSFAVFAATSTEKKEWMLHIERCVQDILRNSKNLDLNF